MLPYLRHRRSGTPWYDRLWTQHATQAAITSRRPHGRHHDGSRDCYLYFRGGRALRLALATILRSHSRRRARRTSSTTAEPAEPAGQQPAGEEPEIAAQAEPTQPAPAAPTNSPTADDFEPTHQIGAGQSVNFRSGPSTTDPIIVALPPDTPLQYLNEDAPTENPSDGDRWMRFRNEAGDEGWIREIDTEPYQP